jgi:hypothetical protein
MLLVAPLSRPSQQLPAESIQNLRLQLEVRHTVANKTNKIYILALMRAFGIPILSGLLSSIGALMSSRWLRNTAWFGRVVHPSALLAVVQLPE